MLGGAIGVALRAALLLPLESADSDLVLPAVTLAINVAGSFLLGILVGWAGERHPLFRAFVGTGVLGGFTTYSAFAVQLVELGGTAPVVSLGARRGHPCSAASIAAALGLRLGHAAGRRAPDRVESPEAAE